MVMAASGLARETHGEPITRRVSPMRQRVGRIWNVKQCSLLSAHYERVKRSRDFEKSREGRQLLFVWRALG